MTTVPLSWKMSSSKTEYSSNGMRNGFGTIEKKTTVSTIREKLQINEWTFSLFLFSFSLAVVLGKLFVNYGDVLHWPIKGHYTLPSLSALPQMSNLSSLPSLPHIVQFDSNQLRATSQKLITASRRYEETVTDAVVEFSTQYGRVVRAALSGLVMIGFSWFIIYKDSSIPGINPPFPFNSLKRRMPTNPGMQLNYFVGLLNGILLFIYMCL